MRRARCRRERGLPEPVEIAVDLPFPPSINRIWRSARGKVHRSKVYLDWATAADMTVMADRQYPKRKIVAEFCAHVVLDHSGRGDLDNRIKAVLIGRSLATSSETICIVAG